METYKIVKLGELKYSRIKAMSILKKELNNFGYRHSMIEIKEIFDILLSSNFHEEFDTKQKHCFDLIFDNNEYLKINGDYCGNGCHFPRGYILPTC